MEVNTLGRAAPGSCSDSQFLSLWHTASRRLSLFSQTVDIYIDWVPSTENLADLNSKILHTTRFSKLRDRILQLCAMPSLESTDI